MKEKRYIDGDLVVSVKIVGIGNGGCDAINEMMSLNICNKNIELKFACIDTDLQNLRNSRASEKLLLGMKTTQGFGTNGDPELGCAAAEESRVEIREMFVDADLVILVTAMGGGTGTGAIPVIAQIANELCLLAAVIIQPFATESEKIKYISELGFDNLHQEVRINPFIVYNECAFDMMKKNHKIDSHKTVNLSVKDNVVAILNIFENLFFAPIKIDSYHAFKEIFDGYDIFIMGIGIASGKNRASIALDRALSYLSARNVNLHEVRHFMVEIISNHSVSSDEFSLIGGRIAKLGTGEFIYRYRITIDNNIGNDLRINVIARV